MLCKLTRKGVSTTARQGSSGNRAYAVFGLRGL